MFSRVNQDLEIRFLDPEKAIGRAVTLWRNDLANAPRWFGSSHSALHFTLALFTNSNLRRILQWHFNGPVPEPVRAR